MYAEKRIIYYTSIEKDPLSINVINTLNHWRFAGNKGKKVLISSGMLSGVNLKNYPIPFFSEK